MKKVKILCIYHKNCADGFASAYVVRAAYKDDNKHEVTFRAMAYGDEMPDVSGFNWVMFVDFSLKYDAMLELVHKVPTVTVIDHHKTAVEELQPLLDEGFIDGTLDEKYSGCVLTWHWFFEGRMPPQILLHVQDRDLWRFALPETKAVMAGVMSRPYDFNTWDVLLGSPVNLREEGEAILRQKEQELERYLSVGQHELNVLGEDIPALNAPPHMASDAGHAMCTWDNPSAIVYWSDGERVNCSLRSIGDVDVSAVAKVFGGGGHKNAAGFSLHLSYWKSVLAGERSQYKG